MTKTIEQRVGETVLQQPKEFVIGYGCASECFNIDTRFGGYFAFTTGTA